MRDALFHAKVRKYPEELGPSGTGNKIGKRTLINANYRILSYQTKKKKNHILLIKGEDKRNFTPRRFGLIPTKFKLFKTNQFGS